MADTYSYALLVDLEGNTTVSKLKNKLIKYFQSKKSNGGDCQVEYESPGRPSAVVRFQDEEVRQRVLQKNTHEIILGEDVLKLSVRLPPDKATDAQETQTAVISVETLIGPRDAPENRDGHTPLAETLRETQRGGEPAGEEELRSTSAVLENASENMNQEFLEMLVENILNACTSGSESPTAEQNFSVESLPDVAMAVVTFKRREETEKFISACPRNRIFRQKKLSVRLLEPTAKVKVENIPPGVSPDHLLLYFEKVGQVEEDVALNEEDQSAVITFQDPKAIHRLLEETHHINKQPVKAYPFYESLGTALYGKDRPTLRLPAGFSESIDQAVWRFLREKQGAAEIIHKAMAQHFCKVDLRQPAAQLSPLPSLLQQKGVKAKDIQQWKDSARAAFTQALSAFISLELQVQTTAWKESEEEVRRVLSGEAVVAVPKEARGVIAVVGLVDDVNRLSQSLNDIIDRIAKRIQRERLSVTEKVAVAPSIYNVLSQDGLEDKVMLEFPELKLTYDSESQSVILYGLMHEVLGANRKVVDGVIGLKRKVWELDDYVLEFLQKEDQEKLTSILLTSQTIDAALEILVDADQKGARLLAASDKALGEAEDQLNRILISEYIVVEDSNVLKMTEWQGLVTHLEETSNISLRKVMVRTFGDYPSHKVVVSGYKDSVMPVKNELDDFLHQNTPVTENIKVRSEAIVKFIQERNSNTWSDKVKDVVKVSFKKEAISLSGARVHVTQCKALFSDLVSSTHFDTLKVSKPGAKKFFQDKEAMYVTTVISLTGCVVQLVEVEDNQHGGQQGIGLALAGGGIKPTYQFQTPDGVEIAVCKADVCDYVVQAVVNAANTDLKHIGGLAGALLDAAGPQLQAESDQLVTSMGQLRPGDCVITGAGGRLRCKHIIHAVGPRFDPADPQRAVGQLRRVVKGSLDLAETHSCLSVALPAISSGNLGFPLNLCAETIVKAVKEHCEDRYGDNCLKRIHLVNKEDKTVQAMEDAVRRVFGGQGTGQQQQQQKQQQQQQASKNPTKPAPPQPPRLVQTTACLGRVQTKEGLIISLMKANIQDATTDVVVNTVGQDLALNRGGVSSALLAAAGPQLQTLVDQQPPTGIAGDVIITTGCNLKSKLVFHTIAPQWDNGQGAAEKMLSEIMEECMDEVEQKGLVSMTFPAIGTGNLGFPKPMVASLMLEEVLKFSTKNPKHLKKVVFILHPGDQQTIQAFTDEFNKRFPTQAATSGSSASSSASSTPTEHSKGPFSAVTTSSSGTHETNMGGVVIQVAMGDITKETSDVIVNSSNQDYSLKSGVSKAILDAAGQTVELECQQFGALPNPGMILTQPGNLQCKKILHLVGQSDPKKIHQAVKDALLLCAKNNYSSIAFPALGTGQGKVQVSQVADAMLDAVVDVVNHNSQNALQLVRVVIFQPAMLKEFHSSLLKKQGADHADSKEKKGFWGKFLSFISRDGDSKPQKDGDFIIKGQQVEPAFFHICGDSQTRVADAKLWISDLILNEQVTNSITDNAILSLSEAERQRICDMQATMGVSVRLEDRSAGGEAQLSIEGLSKDVLTAVNQVQEMLRRARDQEAFNRNVEVAGSMVEWQYQQGGQGTPFLAFDPVANFHLEQGQIRKQEQVEVKVQGQVYKVLLPEGPATDRRGNSLNIRRLDKLAAQDSLPQHWEVMPANTPCLSCPLQPGSLEHNDILTLFQATCKNGVLKIERIQNPSLWKSLQIKKQDMDARNGHQNNEKRLFHGTCYTTVNHINHHGFNRSYAGKNAAMFGNGTYFAVNANYSASNTYSKPNPQGLKYVYLCRVLTGEVTQGRQGMVVPPAKNITSTQLFDSVTDNPARPSMFIVFHDCQAYPEYLITFR